MKRFLTVLFVLGFLFISAAGILEADSIPRIGGNWNLNGTAYVAGERGTLRGSAVATSYIDSDGYEVVTKLVRQADVFDSSGRYFESFRVVFAEAFKIASNSFTIINNEGDTSEVIIESSTRITEKIKGYSQGYYVEMNLVYTRGESESSGSGGCTAGVSSPFALLLVLPLAFLAFKKCR